MDWKRPESKNYPITYKEFDGKIIVNGKKRKFWIQDLTPEFFEQVIEYYKTLYLLDEPLCKYLKIWDDVEAIEEFSQFWRIFLAHQISLICLTKDEKDEIKIAGINILYRQDKDITDYPTNAPVLKKALKICMYMMNRINICEKFKVDCYMGAMGLYVLEEFRGEGIGEKLLATRAQLGAEIGFDVTVTIFTSFISQKQAYRVGFEVLTEEDYENFKNIDEEMDIPEIHNHTKTMKIMYKKL